MLEEKRFPQIALVKSTLLTIWFERGGNNKTINELTAVFSILSWLLEIMR